MKPGYLTYLDLDLLNLIRGHELSSSQEAYRVIVHRYSEKMLESAMRVLQNKSLAKDCVQNVLLRVWENRLNYRIENLPAYLNQAVRIECLRQLQSTRQVQSLNERFESIGGNMEASQPLRYKEMKALLDKVLAALPEDQRKIFLMNREEEKTYKQIAEELQISVKTVEKKMTSSLRHIRTHLNPSDSLAMIVLLFLFTQ